MQQRQFISEWTVMSVNVTSLVFIRWTRFPRATMYDTEDDWFKASIVTRSVYWRFESPHQGGRQGLTAWCASPSLAVVQPHRRIVSHYLVSLHKYTHSIICYILIPLRYIYRAFLQQHSNLWMWLLDALMNWKLICNSPCYNGFNGASRNFVSVNLIFIPLCSRGPKLCPYITSFATLNHEIGHDYNGPASINTNRQEPIRKAHMFGSFDK